MSEQYDPTASYDVLDRESIKVGELRQDLGSGSGRR